VTYRQPAQPRPVDRPLDIRTWNVGPAFGKGIRIPAGLWRVLRGADVVGLIEAARYTKLIRTVLSGWWIVYRAHHPGADRSSDVIVLVRRRKVPRPTITTVGHKLEWRGPKNGNRKRGRSWPVLDWPDLRVAILHRTAGGPKGGTSPRVAGANRPAWHADLCVITDLVEDGPEAVFLPGDQNATADELDEYRRLGLRVFRSPTKVDHAAGQAVEVDAPRLLGKHKSDHFAVRWPRVRARRSAA
jgi:hypothetical protein